MQKPGSPVKWEGNACGVVGVGGGGKTPSSCLFKDLQPQEPNARLVTQCQLCKSHQPTCIFLLLTTRPGGTQSPGGRGGRRRPEGAGPKKRFPDTKAAVEHPQLGLSCLLLRLIPS